MPAELTEQKVSFFYYFIFMYMVMHTDRASWSVLFVERRATLFSVRVGK